MKPQAVLFDCDGVLVDSEPATFALIQSDFAAHGLAMEIPALEDLFIGGTIEGVAEQGRALGADPAQCVVIEDSATGARAAKAAGMRCLGYAPQGENPRLAAAGAEIFTDMAQVPALIGL